MYAGSVSAEYDSTGNDFIWHSFLTPDFGYGYGPSSARSITNLVSNVGVVATDTTGVGTARNNLEACSFG